MWYTTVPRAHRSLLYVAVQSTSISGEQYWQVPMNRLPWGGEGGWWFYFGCGEGTVRWVHKGQWFGLLGALGLLGVSYMVVLAGGRGGSKPPISSPPRVIFSF